MTFDPRSTDVQGAWVPLTVTPSEIPGFLDYAPVYSQFRMKKCILQINRTQTTGLNYLVVPSRTFASLVYLSEAVSAPSDPFTCVPPQQEHVLRQSRWQKEIFPNVTTGKVRVAWHPYTTIQGSGPNVGLSIQQKYQSIYNMNRWAPMGWVNNTSADHPLVTFGPYVVPNIAGTNADPPASTYPIPAVLTCYFQFRGQV